MNYANQAMVYNCRPACPADKRIARFTMSEKRTKALFNGRLLDGLCDDALLLILSYFAWEELLEIGLVNKRLKLCTLTNNDVFWRNFYMKREPAFRKLFENNPSMLKNISNESNPLVDCSQNYKMKFNNVMQQVRIHIRKEKEERWEKIATMKHNPFQNRFYSLNEVNEFKHNVKNVLNYFKVTTVGSTGVGKTCFWCVFAGVEFSAIDYIPTVFDGYSTNVNVDGEPIAFAPWDTVGSDEYYRLRPLSYPNTAVFLVCFACSDEESFFNCYKFVQEIRQHVTENTAIILQMNKVDLRKSKSECQFFVENNIVLIDSNEGEEMARNLGCVTFVETSAKDNTGMKTIHEVIVRSYNLSKCITTPSNGKKCQVQ